MQKQAIRQHYRQLRRTLSQERRKQAENRAMPALVKLVSKHDHVLSYASFADEFETTTINQFLAKAGKLLLPKMEADSLRIFKVNDLLSQLKVNAWGISEPIPELCDEMMISAITFVIVPGVAFDQQSHRIGYGKGYYDRFLANLTCNSHTYGLGFNEQLALHKFPSDKTDVSLTAVLTF